MAVAIISEITDTVTNPVKADVWQWLVLRSGCMIIFSPCRLFIKVMKSLGNVKRCKARRMPIAAACTFVQTIALSAIYRDFTDGFFPADGI